MKNLTLRKASATTHANLKSGLEYIANYQQEVALKHAKLSRNIQVTLSESDEFSEGSTQKLVDNVKTKAMQSIDFYKQFNEEYRQFWDTDKPGKEYPVKFNKQSIYYQRVIQEAEKLVPKIVFSEEGDLKDPYSTFQRSPEYLPWLGGSDAINKKLCSYGMTDAFMNNGWNFWGTARVATWHMTQKLVLEALTDKPQYAFDLNDPTQHNHQIPEDIVKRLPQSSFISQRKGLNVWTGDSGGGYVFGGTGEQDRVHNTIKRSHLCATDCSEFINVINSYQVPQGQCRLSTNDFHQYLEGGADERVKKALESHSVFRPMFPKNKMIVQTIEANRNIDTLSESGMDGIGLNVRCLSSDQIKPIFVVRNAREIQEKTIKIGDTVGSRGHVFGVLNIMR
ncbi:MAG: hypothetical protein ACON5A_01285 [Candidatus Comchoanobacterales bacterium]